LKKCKSIIIYYIFKKGNQISVEFIPLPKSEELMDIWKEEFEKERYRI